MFYNTTKETGDTLETSRTKAKSQDEAVLNYFREYPNLNHTPERCLRHFKIMETLNDNRWFRTPITSIRRSFSNLHNRGLIQKTGEMAKGDFGKMVHTWKLKK